MVWSKCGISALTLCWSDQHTQKWQRQHVIRTEALEGTQRTHAKPCAERKNEPTSFHSPNIPNVTHFLFFVIYIPENMPPRTMCAYIYIYFQSGRKHRKKGDLTHQFLNVWKLLMGKQHSSCLENATHFNLKIFLHFGGTFFNTPPISPKLSTDVISGVFLLSANLSQFFWEWD